MAGDELTDRVSELRAWAESRIRVCREQEQKFGSVHSGVRGHGPPQALIEAWTERRALEAVIAILFPADRQAREKASEAERAVEAMTTDLKARAAAGLLKMIDDLQAEVGDAIDMAYAAGVVSGRAAERDRVVRIVCKAAISMDDRRDLCRAIEAHLPAAHEIEAVSTKEFTAEACGDVEPHAGLVFCECGKLRQADRKHGYCQFCAGTGEGLAGPCARCFPRKSAHAR